MSHSKKLVLCLGLVGICALTMGSACISPFPTGNILLTDQQTQEVESAEEQIQAAEKGPVTKQDFAAQMQQLQELTAQVQSQLQQLQTTPGAVDLKLMFQLQFAMQMMSQFIETVSNSMSAIHNSLMTLVQAMKGQ